MTGAAEVDAAGQQAGVDPTVWTGGASYKSAPLSGTESGIFWRDLARIAYMSDLQRELSSLLLDDAHLYMAAAALAKASIGANPTFSGVSATGSEIGMQLIRAVTAMSTGVTGGVASTATEVLNWVQTFTASGWTDLIGSQAQPVNLQTTGVTGKSATNLNNNTLLAFGGFLDPSSSPIVAEYKYQTPQKSYPIQSIGWMPAGNLFYARAAGFVIAPVNTSFNIRGNIQPNAKGGQTAFQLFGLTFQPGNFLVNET